MGVIYRKDYLEAQIKQFLSRTYHVTITNQVFLDNVLWDIKDFFKNIDIAIEKYFKDDELKALIENHFTLDQFDVGDYFG